MSMTAYAQGPLSSQSYTLPQGGVEYYSNGSGSYTQQINNGYSTSYPLAQQNMFRSELIPVQMQQQYQRRNYSPRQQQSHLGSVGSHGNISAPSRFVQYSASNGNDSL